MMIPAATHVAWFGEQWKWTSEEMPGFNFHYSPADKQVRENKTSGFYRRFRKMAGEARKTQESPDYGKFFRELSVFLKEVYDFPENSDDLVLNPGFYGVSRSFFQKAKAFDELLSDEEIYQAMRNVWIMNGIQKLMELPVELTPAMFAYSLLYPYSDNLLDDPDLSKSDKLMFSWRFEDRLRGIDIPVRDRRELKISELVGMIEQQFDRTRYPEVYESLLAIHAAQTRSIALQKQGEALSREKTLQVCFDKGGASVLADGYLVAGNLTPLQQRFLFGYGIWLQLSDDIQDIADDERENVNTLFSGAADRLELAGLINQTFHFGRTIIHDIGCFPSPLCEEFGKIMVHAIEMMIVQSAGLNHSYLRSDYLSHLEPYSPLSFEFIRKMKEKGVSRRMKMVTSLAAAQ